jgi:hypothetical protein
MNRTYLARAAKLGLRELCVFGDRNTVLCQDERRKYVWALLEPDTALKPADDVIRIESPSAGTEIPVNHPQTKRRLPTVSKPTTDTNGHAQGNGQAKTNGQARKTGTQKASQQDIASLIEQAEKLRTSLHDLMYQASGLVKALKQHRRANKAVETTLATLKSLGV